MIPGNSVKSIGGGPMLRDGVGGNITAPGGPKTGSFEVSSGITSPQGSSMRFRSPVMFSDKLYKISGVTYDSTKTIVPNCIVDLFYTVGDVFVAKVESDVNGNYTFLVGPNLSCYVVAYKAGSPDLAGTTINTLVGA